MVSSIGANTAVNALALQSQVPNVLTAKGSNGEELTEEQQKQVDELKQTDQEVRSHEQAHQTVGGPYAGQIQFEYTVGPDGKKYAIGGEVPIDASPVANNPEATIRKMDIVIRAALAPAEPSSQDQQVARQAQTQRTQAQAELSEQKKTEEKDNNGGEPTIIEQLLEESRDITQETPLKAAQSYGQAAQLTTAPIDAASLFTS